MPLAPLLSRIVSFLEDETVEDFNTLVKEGSHLQTECIPAVARLAQAEPSRTELTGWRATPMVPTLAFKSQALHVAPAIETFHSSGTREAGRSVHHHPFPDLYRHVLDLSFPAACPLALERPPMLSLVPARSQQPSSSLSFMVDHLLTRFGREDSVVAMGPRGLQISQARSWIAARQREGVPALLFTTSLALDQLLDTLEKRYLHFRLAPGSVLFETGGFKGREAAVDPDVQMRRIAEFLGLGPDSVLREYGMTELTSQAYASQASGWRYLLPHWARVHTLDPESLEEIAPGQPGLLAFLDLGNVGSALHVLTEDIGSAEADGRAFTLVGRASDAELRGCSLTAEELTLT